MQYYVSRQMWNFDMPISRTMYFRRYENTQRGDWNLFVFESNTTAPDTYLALKYCIPDYITYICDISKRIQVVCVVMWHIPLEYGIRKSTVFKHLVVFNSY